MGKQLGLSNNPPANTIDFENRRLNGKVEALEKTLSVYRQAIESVTDLVWMFDTSWEIIFVTPSCEKVLGYPVDALLGKDFRNFLVSKYRRKVEEAGTALFSGGQARFVDIELLAHDGSKLEMETSLSAVTDDHRVTQGFLAISRNISDYLRATTALEMASTVLETALETSPDAIFINRLRDGAYTMINHGFSQLTGFTSEDVIGKTPEDLNLWANPRDALRIMTRIRRRGSVKDFEVLFRLRNGEVRTGLLSANIINLSGESHVLSVAKDIDPIKRAETAIKESEAKYRLLVEHAKDAIFILQDGKIKFPNPQTRELAQYLGINLKEKSFFDHIDPIDKDIIFDRQIEDKTVHRTDSYPFRLILSDGEPYWVQLNAVPIKWEGKPATLNFLRDINEQKQLEVQFRHAQKMEAVGTLAGAIAHNFNNLLMGIQGCVSLMLLDTDAQHPNHEELKKIQEQVGSGATLTAQLLGYARKGKIEIQATDLNRLVEKTVDTFNRTRDEISVHYSLLRGLHAVVVDRGQIEQVLLNILNNAADAMPGGGKIFIRTSNVSHQQIHTEDDIVKRGNYALISISDTGLGMDPKIRSRIFEPFFTTKELGQGTGLGLASVYGIVKGHDGYIGVESELDRGTTFDIFLPASQEKVTSAGRSAEAVIKGTGCIMVVDDEPVVLKVTARLLKHIGYTVLEADSGRDAVRIYKRHRESIDLVILDMIMPDIGGGEVFDRLRDINPEVKALLASGYTLDGQASRILRRGCNGFIQKPFSMGQLSQKIADILKTP
ncbi:MAG: PAS domain S-box protein [Desulfobacterales bacterium]|jgi:PAS domain S-box-containing protein